MHSYRREWLRNNQSCCWNEMLVCRYSLNFSLLLLTYSRFDSCNLFVSALVVLSFIETCEILQSPVASRG